MSETVRRALRVLGFLGERPRTVDEVAGFMGLHRTTALRTLQVLEAERFVTRDEGHAFRLASGLYYLANRALENTDLRTIAAPVFETSGAVIGSVSITATTLVCDFEEVLTLVPRLIETTNAISDEYGWRPRSPGGQDGRASDRTPENSGTGRTPGAA